MGDYARGYADRSAGYYDKWYRYNRQDDGAEYDRGCLDAIKQNSVTKDEFTIIEVT